MSVSTYKHKLFNRIYKINDMNFPRLCLSVSICG